MNRQKELLPLDVVRAEVLASIARAKAKKQAKDAETE